MALPIVLTEQAKRTSLARLKKIGQAIAETRKKLELGKRYFAAPSYYPLKSGERWVDDRCIMVESVLGDQDKISMLLLIKRLTNEQKFLREELESEDI